METCLHRGTIIYEFHLEENDGKEGSLKSSNRTEPEKEISKEEEEEEDSPL